MERSYKYVGDINIRISVADCPPGIQIKSIKNLEYWIDRTQEKPNSWGVIPATFVVDLEGYIRIAQRESEHIACAGGEAVLSAGEIFFVYGDRGLEVAEVSNQSTGFCPEPTSWSVVADALDRIPLHHPSYFTREFIFRRCPKCGQLNLIKENLFLCGVCSTDLPEIWNCDRQI